MNLHSAVPLTQQNRRITPTYLSRSETTPPKYGKHSTLYESACARMEGSQARKSSHANDQIHQTLLLAISFIFVLAISVTAGADTGLWFVPVSPCRVADTRLPNGPFGGPEIAGQTTRSFAIPSSACSIPSTAKAYALNVTVVPRQHLGYVTVWPTGSSQPPVSTLNSYDGRVKANAAIISAGTNGAISIFVTDTTHVVLDISGYFVPNTDESALAFFPLNPCRVADTRNPTGPLGGPYLHGGIPRDLPILSSSCNIPGSARAYSLNFTVVPKRPLGFLTVWPSSSSRPLVSTLNASTGAVTANGAIVPAVTSGDISVFATDDTELVVDINGYFGSASSASDPLSLYAMAPCRVLDTRSTQTMVNGTLAVNVAGSPCAIPSSAPAFVLNATVVPPGLLGFLTLWPHGAARPLVSTLNASDGFVTSNMAIVPDSIGWIDAFSSESTHLVLDITGYFAREPLQISTTSLPSGTVNTSYSTSLRATGGLTPYVWNTESGALPPGLTLSSAGVISGLPSIAGTYTFTVRVTDSETPAAFLSKQLTITINPPQQQTITLSPKNLNGLVYSNLDDSFANTAYPNQSEVAVGQSFYGGFFCGQGAWASILSFDLSTFQAKTIDSATLTVTADSVGVGYYPIDFQIGVVASSWNPATVTWNQAASMYFYTYGWSSTGPQFRVLHYPTYRNQVYNVDAKYVLQNWLTKYFANDGLFFESTTYWSYCDVSNDTYTLIPRLTVTYH